MSEASYRVFSIADNQWITARDQLEKVSKYESKIQMNILTELHELIYD